MNSEVSSLHSEIGGANSHTQCVIALARLTQEALHCAPTTVLAQPPHALPKVPKLLVRSPH